MINMLVTDTIKSTQIKNDQNCLFKIFPFTVLLYSTIDLFSELINQWLKIV